MAALVCFMVSWLPAVPGFETGPSVEIPLLFALERQPCLRDARVMSPDTLLHAETGTGPSDKDAFEQEFSSASQNMWPLFTVHNGRSQR